MEKIACAPVVSISVVSHGQISLIINLLRDIQSSCSGTSLELILSLNIDEALPFSVENFPLPVKVIRNAHPMGFAANHNQAFTHATGRFYCVLNPDIGFASDPFPPLLERLKDASVGVAAPVVLGESGEIEDSARHFPTPFKIVCKALGKCKGSDYVIGDQTIYPDWAGGMFLLFPRDVFEKLHGFDQRYFLYYEDVDICARLRLQGYEVAVCPQSRVIHHAQRTSHRSFKYFRWHLTSMMRFFMTLVFWRVQCRKWL